jgi:hypothetical protein
VRRRLLCRLGRHDWQLIFVQSRWSGNPDEQRLVGETYQCWHCPARRTEPG